MRNVLRLLTSFLLAASGPVAGGATEDELRAEIRRLEAELEQARAALAAREQADAPASPGRSADDPSADSEASSPGPPPDPGATEALPDLAAAPMAPNVELPLDGETVADEEAVRVGKWTLGGAMRVNWVLGDYDGATGGPSRGGHGGDFELDTFRLDLDYAHRDFFGRAEYRWYSGTSFFHTLDFGYSPNDREVWRAGLTRSPFGLGPFATGNSWFFDQHYYVGLADDMDLGLVHTRKAGPWTFDFGVFASPPPNMRGSSPVGARYSFDIVDARGDPNYFGNRAATGYSEAGQLNFRAIRRFAELPAPTDVGLSLQYGRLRGRGGSDDAYPLAVSAHSVSSFGDWNLKLQASYYDYDSEFDHISGGFYDFTTDIAAEGTVLAAGLSHTWERPVSWLDSITVYNDFSVIRKSAPGFRSSAMNVLGATLSRGNWAIYIDWAFSNGNEFVGRFRPGMLVDNPGRTWQSRYNINLGYYF
jgi:hypothetical protein